jgi:hypothetical protein
VVVWLPSVLSVLELAEIGRYVVDFDQFADRVRVWDKYLPVTSNGGCQSTAPWTGASWPTRIVGGWTGRAGVWPRREATSSACTCAVSPFRRRPSRSGCGTPSNWTAGASTFGQLYLADRMIARGDGGGHQSGQALYPYVGTCWTRLTCLRTPMQSSGPRPEAIRPVAVASLSAREPAKALSDGRREHSQPIAELGALAQSCVERGHRLRLRIWAGTVPPSAGSRTLVRKGATAPTLRRSW